MINIAEIRVEGQSDAGPFLGRLEFGPGLQVVSAQNAFGKSLAVKAIAWCLGLEPIFGLQADDASCFSEAAREELELADGKVAKVLSSECSIRLAKKDGSQLVLKRAIRGDSRNIDVIELPLEGEPRSSRLQARRDTMQDAHGGLQHFLFEALGWPRQAVTTFKGGLSEVYLENLAPSFYIDQQEGWSNIQAQQISRYGQQQISEVALEYILGALPAIKSRVLRQGSLQRNAQLRDQARSISDAVGRTLMRRGWRVEWSGHGTVADVLNRWRKKSLKEILFDEANVDFGEMFTGVRDRISALQAMLTAGAVDARDSSAPAGASQRVIEFKTARHNFNIELNTLRSQFEQMGELLDSLDHRIRAATDLLRLKTTGVGRLDHVECPTCHRDLDPTTFSLTVHSAESVSAHIDALRRDHELISKNRVSIEASITSVRSVIDETDRSLREAERALVTVTTAVGTEREQIAQVAARLTTAERELDRVTELNDELNELQTSINEWISEASEESDSAANIGDLSLRKSAFLKSLRKYLSALGHSAVKSDNLELVSVDEQYVPYLGHRRLRSLGSASDQSRLIAAYSLALAATAISMDGFHPGFVILDEPLQQNPDGAHKELFLAFLSQELARDTTFQTIIFTWLSDDELERLRSQGTKVITPEGRNFLKLY